jgi:hypothetical protein
LKISNEKPIKIVNNYPKNRESKNRLYLVLISYKFFNEQNFVKLEGMTWKDYEHSTVYEVEVKKGGCLVSKYYDKEL